MIVTRDKVNEKDHKLAGLKKDNKNLQSSLEKAKKVGKVTKDELIKIKDVNLEVIRVNKALKETLVQANDQDERENEILNHLRRKLGSEIRGLKN